jgi:hypothetical protein
MPAGTPVQVRLPDDELSALDRYRREKANPPSRSRALRELAHISLFGSFNSPNPGAIEQAVANSPEVSRPLWRGARTMETT